MGLMNLFRRKVEMPTPFQTCDYDHEVDYTPDLWNLEQYKFQLVFIYDECMRGHKAYDVIKEGSVSIAPCFTNTNYTLWKKKLGRETYPIPLETPYFNVPKARIKGELWAMRPYQIIKLDKYKQNGVLFQRKRVYVALPYRELRYNPELSGFGSKVLSQQYVRLIKVWMYLGVEDIWNDQLDAGFSFEPVGLYKSASPWLNKYYYFGKKEYDV